MKIKIGFLLTMLLFNDVQARYYAVKNDHQFFDEINKHEFVVACFLQTPEHGSDDEKKHKKNINLLHDTVKSAAEADPYKKLLKNEVGFLVVDMSKDSMQPLIEKFNMSIDELPQFLLFKNGKAITTMSGHLAKLVGFVAKSDVLAFVGGFFGKDFDEILAKKSDEQDKDREMQLARYQAYAACRYPYGGYAPYNIWGSPSAQMYSGYAQFYPYGFSYNGYAYL